MATTLTQATLVTRLEAALLKRDIHAGYGLLDRHQTMITHLDPASPQAIPLLLCLAQWTDLGYSNHAFLDEALALFTGVRRADLNVLDFLRLRMAESYRSLRSEQLGDAVDTLELVLNAGRSLLPPYLLFLANFWKGRALRKRGDYEHALGHIAEARSIAQAMNALRLVAVSKIHESWLAFQKGERRYAFTLLDEAEVELRPTGHALSLGNIESARGRFVRRTGDYTGALTHFENAIRIYEAGCPSHPNLARALVNAAYVKRLIALDMQPRRTGSPVTGATHAKSLKISREALELLRQAGEIYSQHHHQGGTGSVLVNAAHLHLESGDTEQALTEAERAYRLGEAKHDQILMARARIVLAAAELAQAEEQLGEVPNTALHATRAVQFADEAIELALHTQNKRLLAEAYIVRGSAAADDYFKDWDLARTLAAKSSALLGQDDRDHLFKVLGQLKLKVLEATEVDETLRMWSAGHLGDKTFQQIQEEFAELVIPKVWMHAGRNVSTVARNLSISPKKIRRILRNTKHTEV